MSHDNSRAGRLIACGFVAVALLVSVCVSQSTAMIIWDELADGGGDSGQSLGSAQNPSGTGELIRITGTNPGPPKPFPFTGNFAGNDIDLYWIRITNPASFSASTVNGGSLYDHGLFLFDKTGKGILHNQDAGPFVFQSVIPSDPFSQSIIASLPVDDYAIGIAPFSGGNVAQAQTVNGNMFDSPPPGASVQPNAMSFGLPLIGWTTTFPPFGRNAGDTYVINFTGAGPSTIPEPGAVALCGVVAALVVGQRCVRRLAVMRQRQTTESVG